MWRLSDGTSIELGGRVTGASGVAEEVRQAFDRCALLGPLPFPLGPQPDSSGRLVPTDAAALDAWLRHQAPIWGVTVVERPEIKNPLVDRRILKNEPGAVY